ncbi:MAG TPA: serine hydrolase [Acidimicrobiales bacterium]|nr:serine hydrolase [Acidimicrobiales bacterium]
MPRAGEPGGLVSTTSWTGFRSFLRINRRLRLCWPVLVLLLLAVSTVPADGQPAPVPAVRARAWVLVDAGTGAVIDGFNDRAPLPPASLTKLLTALVAVRALESGDSVPVSERAAAMPARKLNMKAGHLWPLRDTLHALLLSSANDAAAALAERVAGSLEGFAPVLQASAARLGLEDDPVLRDPSGFDDTSAVDGGNLVSARDLAIVVRAALADPELASAVRLREYAFAGPDGLPHRLINHNRLLRLYPGAIGMKTGYTRKAGNTLAAAASRDGRTMIVVLLGAQDMYGAASTLLDRGFASPAGAAAGRLGDRLPAVRRLPASSPLVDTTGAGLALVTGGAGADDRAGGPGLRLAATGTLSLVGTACVVRIRVLQANAARRRTRRRHPAHRIGSAARRHPHHAAST